MSANIENVDHLATLHEVVERALNPERFVHAAPKPQALPEDIRINPPNAAATPHNAR